jgi:hypothetical protein
MIHQLPCLALVILLAVSATADVTKPTGTVVCTTYGFAITIKKPYETGKTQVIDIKIGDGKDNADADDSDCSFTGTKDNEGNVAAIKNSQGFTGATVEQNKISSTYSRLPYAKKADNNGQDGKAKCGGTLKDTTKKVTKDCV